MILRFAATVLAALTWTHCVLAQPFEGWWIVLASYPKSEESMTDDVRKVLQQARPCAIKTFNDFSGKFAGFTPGYMVFVPANSPYLDRDIAIRGLSSAQRCFPGAYVKRARYLGE